MSGGFGVFYDGFCGIAGVDLSSHAREISIDHNVAELANNTHGDLTSLVVAGLEEWTITVTFLQDFASGQVDATLAPLAVAGHSPFGVEVGADATSSVSSTNPRYSGQAILTAYRPLGGAHGSNLEVQATFKCASDLTRRTS